MRMRDERPTMAVQASARIARAAQRDDDNQHQSHDADPDSENAGWQHESYMGSLRPPRTPDAAEKQRPAAVFAD